MVNIYLTCQEPLSLRGEYHFDSVCSLAAFLRSFKGMNEMSLKLYLKSLAKSGNVCVREFGYAFTATVAQKRLSTMSK